MQNYAMEFKKFSAREIKSSYPITAISMHRTLCQDLLFDLSSRTVSVDSFTFSSAYFYDFYKIREGVVWDNIFVLDGVSILHKSTGTSQPLIRDRALYSFLYTDISKPELFARALVTNPWLNDLCKQPFRLLSERVVSIMKNINSLAWGTIYSAIVDHLDSGFTPRGVWGMDYMFMWKGYHLTARKEIAPGVTLITLEEYIESFNTANQEVMSNAVAR